MSGLPDRPPTRRARFAASAPGRATNPQAVLEGGREDPRHADKQPGQNRGKRADPKPKYSIQSRSQEQKAAQESGPRPASPLPAAPRTRVRNHRLNSGDHPAQVQPAQDRAQRKSKAPRPAVRQLESRRPRRPEQQDPKANGVRKRPLRYRGAHGGGRRLLILPEVAQTSVLADSVHHADHFHESRHQPQE